MRTEQSGWLIFAGAVLVLLVLSTAGYWIDRTVFYPQIRANTVANPDRSIANRKYFHDELQTILATDENIKTLDTQITQFKAENPKPWDAITEQSYSDLETQMSGLQQIRMSDIADYNAHADNPDVARDKDSWLPSHIDSTESVDAEITLITQMNHN